MKRILAIGLLIATVMPAAAQQLPSEYHSFQDYARDLMESDRRARQEADELDNYRRSLELEQRQQDQERRIEQMEKRMRDLSSPSPSLYDPR